MFVTWAVVILLAGYILGSISFAVIVARARGVDILKAGSGNPGATNVKRVLGRGPGNFVFVLDVCKGFVSTGWPMLVWPESGATGWYPIIGLAGAILGHSFSLFLRLRGGKGVAVTIGGMLAIEPFAMLIAAGVWVATFYTTRYVSLASILLALSLPISLWFLKDHEGEFLLGCALALLIVVRHHANIRRLIGGTENRFAGKSEG